MKIRKKYRIRQMIAFMLSMTLLISFWQVPVSATEEEFGETIASLFGVTLVIQEDGSLWSWGQNGNGQLGDGTTGNRYYPQKIMDQVISIALTESSAYALKSDGSLWAWGNNNGGQLGNGTTVDSLSPLKVLEEVRSIFIAEENIFAVKDDGSLWSWGDNSYGQLGDGTTDNRAFPAKIMEDVVQVISKDDGIFAIQTDDSLWVWGKNMSHQLGIGSENVISPVPRKILDNVRQVEAKSSLIYAVLQDDSLWRWGSEQIPGASSLSVPTPQKIMDDVQSIVDDFGGVYVIKNDGNLWTWNQPQSLIGTPVQLSGANQLLSEVDEIFVGSDFSAYAKKNDGSLWGWGRNDVGQVGNGSFSGQATPVKIMDDIRQCIVPERNVYVIQEDDSLWAWGENTYFGQVGDGSGANQSSPQKIKDDVKRVIGLNGTMFAVEKDNSLWGWGNNSSGQLGVGSTAHQFSPRKVMEKVAMTGTKMISQEPLVISPKPLSVSLEVIVRQTLDKLTGELTDSDWQRLIDLDLTGVRLESLGGLEKAKNLKTLDLSFAQIDEIMTIALLPNLQLVTLKNSKVPADQLELLKRRLTKVNFRILNISITDSRVKLWNTNQEGDVLTGAAEEIIADAGRQKLGSSGQEFVIHKEVAKTGMQKAEAAKEQLYAKAAQENRELNKELETVVKITLTGNEKPVSKLRIQKDIKELKEIDKLIVEVKPDVDIELTGEQIQENTSLGDLEVEVEEVTESVFYPDSEKQGFGGKGKQSKTYRIKMKKKNVNAKVGLSLKTDADPYNAIFRKWEQGEEVIGGKYDSKSKKMKVKIGDDGEYYVRKNEKNFTDIEGLPTKQKEMIKILASKGILQGNNGQFMPNVGITRSEIMTILVRLSYVYDGKAISGFKDVAVGNWYYPYISSGVKIGVVNGYPDNTFKPMGQIGSAELTKMNTMMLVYKKGYRFPKELQKYLRKLAANSTVPNWARAYIAMGEREGLLIKNINGLFDGNQIITRGQAAEMLYRLYEKL